MIKINIGTLSKFARISSAPLAYIPRVNYTKSFIQQALRTTMAAESAQLQQFDPKNIEIHPRCYPLAERGDTVENYHGVQV